MAFLLKCILVTICHHIFMQSGEFAAQISIRSLGIFGYLPPKALALVVEWGIIHREELIPKLGKFE